LRYELIDCGLHGQELLGTDVVHIRPQEALVVPEGADGLRWYRCLRCDSRPPLLPPDHPDDGSSRTGARSPCPAPQGTARQVGAASDRRQRFTSWSSATRRRRPVLSE